MLGVTSEVKTGFKCRIVSQGLWRGQAGRHNRQDWHRAARLPGRVDGIEYPEPGTPPLVVLPDALVGEVLRDRDSRSTDATAVIEIPPALTSNADISPTQMSVPVLARPAVVDL